MYLKIVKKCFLWNNLFFMRQIENAYEQKWFKISTSMCIPSLRTIYETCCFWKPLTPHWSPHHPRPDRLHFFLFYSLVKLYASMVTKNKFITCPARLPPGYRSINARHWNITDWFKNWFCIKLKLHNKVSEINLIKQNKEPLISIITLLIIDSRKE